MNCRNCGAATELFESRAYFFCRYCGSIEFIEPGPGDVTVLGPSGEGLACPVCAIPLALASLDRAHRVLYCERCRGVLLTCSTFATVVTARRASPSTPVTPPIPLDAKELERLVDCPRCQARMTTHPYQGPGSIVIDTCSPCELLWLDSGELKQVSEAPGGDRGPAAARRTEEELVHHDPSRTAVRVGPGIDILALLRDLL
jgi:Zn-finger nucleic acid-binding protein